MSSNSRITCSKGPSDGTSLPLYTRPRKDASKKAGNAGNLQPPTQQQTVCDPLNSTVGHSPFARPGSRAGASTAPATPTGMLSASASPFAWPGSRAGSARSEVDFPSAAPQVARSLSCNLTLSSMGEVVFPPDANTSTSWEVIVPACDEEVAGIMNGQSQHHANGPADVNADSNSSNQGIGVDQVSDINSTNNLGTLYNQDFFIADMTNRRLSQIPNKMNYPYPLPNGHTTLQLRLPDLLIYLKTDTYLMDVNTMRFTLTKYRKCQSHPNCMQLRDTINCCTPSRVTLSDLVSIHRNLQLVECPKRHHRRHLLQAIARNHQPLRADLPSSSTSLQHSALKHQPGCSPEMNGTRCCKIT